jgi:diguanylate cyclase (GGDEF)-like protein
MSQPRITKAAKTPKGMTVTAGVHIALVADPEVCRAKVWSKLSGTNVHAFNRRECSLETWLPADVPVLLYQVGPRFADAVRLLDRVLRHRRDLCVILIGPDIGADRTARLLRKGAYDYLAWPCPVSRLSEAIQCGLANRRTFLLMRDLPDELARTNHALAQDRDELAQCNRHLSYLHQLTQALSGTLEADAIVKALFAGLPSLIAADLVGLARTDPDKVWTWSQPQDVRGANALRSQLSNRLGRMAGRATSRHGGLRLVRRANLASVPICDDAVQDRDGDSVSIHQIKLAIGSHGLGILHVQRACDRPYTGQEQQLLATIAAALAVALGNADVHGQIQELALRDPLTGVLNRRALNGPLQRELNAGLRYGASACLLILDLDYFKSVNDRLGHVAGDGVLERVAALVQERVREVDSVGRYGGEEFAVVLPHTDLSQAQVLAERIRAEIERRAFDLDDGSVRITASVGVASLHDSSIDSIGRWIAAADSALYEAKSRGRNRVAVHSDHCAGLPHAAAVRAVA